MARPTKQGIDYYNVDVGMCDDDKIFLIEADCGEVAYGRIHKLLSRIYKDNGYFKVWDEKAKKIFSRRYGIPINELDELIDSCLNSELFNKTIHEKYSVLTSSRIQRNFIFACEKRSNISIIEEFYALTNGERESIPDRITGKITLISGESEGVIVTKTNRNEENKEVIVTKTHENDEKSEVIVELTPQKKRKEKESKVKEKEIKNESLSHFKFVTEFYKKYNLKTAQLRSPNEEDYAKASGYIKTFTDPQKAITNAIDAISDYFEKPFWFNTLKDDSKTIDSSVWSFGHFISVVSHVISAKNNKPARASPDYSRLKQCEGKY